MVNINTKLKKFIKDDQSGSALIFTLIAMVFVMLLSLALLLTAYSLFHSSTSRMNKEQAKEYAKTLSEELQRQIELKSDEDKKSLQTDENSLWYYIRDNVWTSKWPYHNEDEWGHEARWSYKYFDINVGNETQSDKMDNVTVRLSWESEFGVSNKSGTLLEVEVSCEKSGEYANVLSVYELQVNSGSDGKENWSWSLSERK